VARRIQEATCENLVSGEEVRRELTEKAQAVREMMLDGITKYAVQLPRYPAIVDRRVEGDIVIVGEPDIHHETGIDVLVKLLMPLHRLGDASGRAAGNIVGPSVPRPVAGEGAALWTLDFAWGNRGRRNRLP